MNPKPRLPAERARPVVEGARRALQPKDGTPPIPVPEDDFGRAQIERAHAYVREIEESVGPSDGERLYRFSKAKRDFLDTLDDARIDALDAMITHHIEHGIVVRDRRRLAKAGLALMGAAWGAVVWGGDALEWIIGKIPLAKTLLHMWKGNPP